MSSSDDFDLVIEAMLEAPYQKKEKHLNKKGEIKGNTGSERSSRSASRECRRSRDRSVSQLRSHSSGSTERGRYSSQHRTRRRRRRSGNRRRGRTHGRRTRHRDHRGRHRGERARHRHHSSHSRSPRFSRSRSRSPRYRSRSISRDRVYGRTPEERDACTILCLQLSGQIRPRDLESFFSSIGKVRDVKIISDRSSRRSKGIAYVEFYSVDSVPQAISLSGTKLLGVPIIIQASQAEKNRPDPGVGHPQSAGDSPLKLYVGSLHANITQDMLRAIFTPFGKIDSLHLIKDPLTGISKGYGFVTFADAECARRALQQLQGFELAGKPLRLSPVTDRWEPDPAASVLDTDDTERPGISLGPSSRLQLMARLAKGSGLEIPPATQAVLQLRNIYPFGILMPTAAGVSQQSPRQSVTIETGGSTMQPPSTGVGPRVPESDVQLKPVTTETTDGPDQSKRDTVTAATIMLHRHSNGTGPTPQQQKTRVYQQESAQQRPGADRRGKEEGRRAEGVWREKA